MAFPEPFVYLQKICGKWCVSALVGSDLSPFMLVLLKASASFCANSLGCRDGCASGSIYHEADLFTLVPVAIALLREPLIAKLTSVGLGAQVRPNVILHIGQLGESLLAQLAGEFPVHSHRLLVHLVIGAPLLITLLQLLRSL